MTFYILYDIIFTKINLHEKAHQLPQEFPQSTEGDPSCLHRHGDRPSDPHHRYGDSNRHRTQISARHRIHDLRTRLHCLDRMDDRTGGKERNRLHRQEADQR